MYPLSLPSPTFIRRIPSAAIVLFVKVLSSWTPFVDSSVRPVSELEESVQFVVSRSAAVDLALFAGHVQRQHQVPSQEIAQTHSVGVGLVLEVRILIVRVAECRKHGS